ncbi:hypothetical protein SVIOM342S_01700 [Streptomyces violaceorubidus]
MSRIRHVRGPRLVLAGTAATTAALLIAALAPGATAAGRPSRAVALGHAAAALSDHAAALDLTDAQDTAVRDVIVDADGTQHVRYDRTYRHLPVLGGDFVVHLAPDGDFRGADRATDTPLSPPTVTPRLSAPRAAGLAANALRAANPGELLRKLTAEPELVVDATAPLVPASAVPPGHEHLVRPVSPAVSQPVVAAVRPGAGPAETALLEFLRQETWYRLAQSWVAPPSTASSAPVV